MTEELTLWDILIGSDSREFPASVISNLSCPATEVELQFFFRMGVV